VSDCQVIVSDILHSDHLPVVSYLLDHVRTRNISDPVDKFIDWERFHSLAPELISPRIQFGSGEEADKAACNFTASVASVYRLSTRKITRSYLNKDLPGVKSLLKHRRRLRKPWQVTRDPASVTALNWVAKTIRRMTGRKVLERLVIKVGNCEVTPQTAAYCEIAHEKEWTKDTNHCSWTFKNNTYITRTRKPT
jgi:hypothetical protein